MASDQVKRKLADVHALACREAPGSLILAGVIKPHEPVYQSRRFGAALAMSALPPTTDTYTQARFGRNGGQ